MALEGAPTKLVGRATFTEAASFAFPFPVRTTEERPIRRSAMVRSIPKLIVAMIIRLETIQVPEVEQTEFTPTVP